jgi:hypothetical protein
MPANTVYVGRPSAFGNPFAIDSDFVLWTGVALGFTGDRAGRSAAAVALYRTWMTGKKPKQRKPKPGGEIAFDGGAEISADGMVMGFAAHAAMAGPVPKLPPRPDVTSLRGKDLACFCPLDQPCHADVLLELANAPSGS